MQKALVFSLCILCLSCNKESSNTLNLGIWRAEIQVSDGQFLPFNFEVTSAHSLKLFNADEVIFVDDITYKNDSVLIKMPAFEDYYISAKLTDSTLSGVFVEENRDRIVPITAKFGAKDRFKIEEKPTYNISGHWETVFGDGIEEVEEEALGIFKQIGNHVTGTFRTTTGDYRFLEGVLNGDQLKLSTFDGSHVYLFTATVTDSTLQGTFYSGNHFKESFSAKRNETYELPDPESLTFLKEGYDALAFTFPDISGNMVSLTDERFKNKVVIVQLMGSWCPNCLDETKYYSEYYRSHKDLNVEFVAIAFEYAKTKEKAFKSMARLKDNIGIDYPMVLAQFGTSDKVKAQEKLPMLNHVLSYPTTIFIDKKGKVRKIHTGFNGPATGEKYVEFKKDFEGFVDSLLME
ncbi:peroxiredoxin family protein [Flavobacteriaceae bacterium LMO-SS05]